VSFEILSTIELTASAAAVVATLSFALTTNARRRILFAAVLAAWFVVVVVLGATLALAPNAGVGAAGLGAAVMAPVAAICLAFFTAPSVRAALLAIPLPMLVATHAARVLGVSFVLLYAANRLPAPFAPSAGWGDIVVGLTALPVAWLIARYGARVRGVALAWNVIGSVDLIAAMGFGATSAPGPIQIFTGPPDTALMTTLPWILIPCFLVPSYLSLHVAIFYRLSRMRPAQASSNRGAPHVLAPVRTSLAQSGPSAQPASYLKSLYRVVATMSA
jgi:hypothetical protein